MLSVLDLCIPSTMPFPAKDPDSCRLMGSPGIDLRPNVGDIEKRRTFLACPESPRSTLGNAASSSASDTLLLAAMCRTSLRMEARVWLGFRSCASMVSITTPRNSASRSALATTRSRTRATNFSMAPSRSEWSVFNASTVLYTLISVGLSGALQFISLCASWRKLCQNLSCSARFLVASCHKVLWI